jgi:uncharacterized membrane protein
MEFVIGLILLLLLVGPILGIAAWVRVRNLQRETLPPNEIPKLIARIFALEQRLERLEQRSAAGAPAAVPEAPARSAPAPPAPPATPVQPPPTAAAPPPGPPGVPLPPRPSPSPSRSAPDLETLIAGRWLNRIGLLLVLIAVAYFLKLVIDNEWIGPTGQVAVGILAGAGLLGFSQGLLGRGYLYFSEGITALGSGVFYLSLWAGSNYYNLFSLDVAFFAMIAVTAATVAIAVGRDSQRIALLALVGGFLTPWLLSTGKDAQVVLFTYVAVLNAGLLAVAWKKAWRWLELPAFFFTQIYFWGWYDGFYHVSQPLVRTLAFASLFFAEFSALSVIRARRLGAVLGEQGFLVLCNGFFYLTVLLTLLYDPHRWMATFATLGLAAVHLAILRALPTDTQDEQRARITRLLFAGLALTFVTIAIPVRLEGKWITMAFAVEAAVLLWSGFRARAWQLRAAGLVLFGAVLLRLVTEPLAGGTFLLNERFATFAVTIACIAAALVLADRQREEVREQERAWFALLGVAINVVAVWALSLESYEYFRPYLGSEIPNVRLDARLAQQLALSLVWTLYATALIVLGVRRNQAGLRWQALGLFGLTLVKVFFFDLSFLSGVYRVVSSIVLGLMLVGVSFLYQRRLAVHKAEEEK